MLLPKCVDQQKEFLNHSIPPKIKLKRQKKKPALGYDGISAIYQKTFQVIVVKTITQVVREIQEHF